MGRDARDAFQVRHARREDVEAIHAIYDVYVAETPVTFDVTPRSTGQREAWFEQFSESGPHRLLVACVDGRIAGFASSKSFRPKEAYATSVETTVYLGRDHFGRGLATGLYEGLFAALEYEDVHRAYAGITLPNDRSVALHERFGFRAIGTFEEVGRKFGRYWSVQWFEKRLA